MDFLTKIKIDIAKKSIEVFANKGFRNSTIKDIMEAASVSRGWLYGHFDNIEDVFIESLKIHDTRHLMLRKEKIWLTSNPYGIGLYLLWMTVKACIKQK